MTGCARSENAEDEHRVAEDDPVAMDTHNAPAPLAIHNYYGPYKRKLPPTDGMAASWPF